MPWASVPRQLLLISFDGAYCHAAIFTRPLDTENAVYTGSRGPVARSTFEPGVGPEPRERVGGPQSLLLGERAG